MKRLKQEVSQLWAAHAWFRSAAVMAAFAGPWLLFALMSPARSPVGVVIDLVLVSTVGGVIVYESWNGFSEPRDKARGVLIALGLVNLAAAEFAYAYWSVAQQNPGAFTEPLDRAGAAYLSVATFVPIDPGGLAPLSSGARVVATGQMLFALAAVAVGLTSLIGARTSKRTG